jgi:uncharacterized membrane protein
MTTIDHVATQTDNRSPSQSAVVQSTAFAVAGLSGIAYGLWRRRGLGWPVLLGGCYFLYRAAKQDFPPARNIQLAQTVNRTSDEIFTFWRDFNNWPLFMDGMDRMQSVEHGFARWTGEGGSIQGASRILDEQPGSFLSWRSRVGTDVYEASLDLHPAPADRGTEIHLRLVGLNPQPAIRQLLRKVTGDSTEQWGRETLRGLKQLMEAGEVPTTDGQPHGVRGAKGKAERVVFRENTEERRRAPRTVTKPSQELAAS